ncbi:MAG: polyprenyl synthetase family protein [Planctomycetota bacterium]
MSISDASLFTPDILALRDVIDQRLDFYSGFGSTDREEKASSGSSWSVNSLGSSHHCPDRLREAIRYMLLAPAKRIRPLLVLTAARACDGNLENAMPAACAVEMIHAYSLIHDDLPAMDDDDLRRGRPSCHIQFDEATAILAGDALIPLAFEVVSRDIQPPETAAKCVAILARAAGGARLVGGQVDDLAGDSTFDSLEDLEKIHRRKTGALLTVSLEMGGITAGAGRQQLESLTNYGNHLGLAFQIVDDLLDLRGEQAKMGKRTGKDESKGKLTYPSLLGETQSEQRARELIDAAIEAVSSLGSGARPLEQIARVVIERSR